MKDTMDCAYHLGRQEALAHATGPQSNKAWTLWELEESLVNGCFYSPQSFYVYTGQKRISATRGEIEAVVRWWARGYHKGWTESVAQRQLQTTGGV